MVEDDDDGDNDDGEMMGMMVKMMEIEIIGKMNSNRMITIHETILFLE